MKKTWIDKKNSFFIIIERVNTLAQGYGADFEASKRWGTCPAFCECRCESLQNKNENNNQSNHLSLNSILFIIIILLIEFF